MGLEAILDPR